MLMCGVLAVNAAALDSTRLKRGYDAYVNLCAGCHALKYVRLQKLRHDLQLADDEGVVVLNQVSLPPEEGLLWFGKMPPDLSLAVSVRGKVWLGAYLQGFHPDSTKIFGTDNALLPGVMMPNPFTTWVNNKTECVADLVYFLDYAADPARQERLNLGRWVVLFLFIFWLIVYALQRLLWKKIFRHIE